MYNLVIGAIFKNEAGILKEWLDHYFSHGVEHAYLINDESTDDFESVLKPYREKGLITLFNARWKNYAGRQPDMYTTFFMPHFSQFRWLIIADLDEFLWSPRNKDLREVLKECSHLTQIQFVQTQFGSAGHVTQPASVVQGFTKKRRSQFGSGDSYGYKYIVNTAHSWKHLTVHYAMPTEETKALECWLILGPEWFQLNHYACQSREYWNNIKCKRGDVNEFKILDEDKFNYFDTNDVDDFGLANQNRQ